jgi:hypothetical protein
LNYASGKPVPGSIVNEVFAGRVAWLADIYEDLKMDDDERLIFLSLLLWVSKKEELLPEMLILPYINVEAKDMYEVYLWNLGLAYPI